jgi:hypothetical protein
MLGGSWSRSSRTPGSSGKRLATRSAAASPFGEAVGDGGCTGILTAGGRAGTGAVYGVGAVYGSIGPLGIVLPGYFCAMAGTATARLTMHAHPFHLSIAFLPRLNLDYDTPYPD